MKKQPQLFQLKVSLALILTAVLGLGQIQAVNAHPYQDYSLAEYQRDQAKWRAMIERDPKNPEPYLELGASLTSEAAEGYWCNTSAIAVYREAIAIVPPNAQIHLRLGRSLVSEPDVRCDEPDPATRQAEIKEGLFHLRKAITIASETASLEDLYKATDALKIENP